MSSQIKRGKNRRIDDSSLPRAGFPSQITQKPTERVQAHLANERNDPRALHL
jgi:hypothetical protein